jgi:LuxR family maltose regulon positive regulatory protein
MSISVATLRLAQHNPKEAIAALAPLLDGSRPGPFHPAMSAPEAQFWGSAFVVEAIARDALGDSPGAATALERALDLAEPDGVLIIFMESPAPGLLERHARRRTAHAALIADILSLLAGRKLLAPSPARPQPALEPLSYSELRVLRYLPTNLRAPKIARQL